MEILFDAVSKSGPAWVRVAEYQLEERQSGFCASDVIRAVKKMDGRFILCFAAWTSLNGRRVFDCRSLGLSFTQGQVVMNKFDVCWAVFERKSVHESAKRLEIHHLPYSFGPVMFLLLVCFHVSRIDVVSYVCIIQVSIKPM